MPVVPRSYYKNNMILKLPYSCMYEDMYEGSTKCLEHKEKKSHEINIVHIGNIYAFKLQPYISLNCAVPTVTGSTIKEYIISF